MKVIFANNFFYIRGGSERVFFDEMEMLKSNGHIVIPFSRHFEKNEYSEYSNYFAPSMDLENISPIKKFTTAFKLIYSFECKKSLRILLKEFKPDIIHAHNIYGRLTTSIIDEAMKHNIPVVMTLHDYKLICPSYLMLRNGRVCDKCIDGSFYHCSVFRCHKDRLFPSIVYTIESYFNKYLNKYNYVRYFISPSKFLTNMLVKSGIPEERIIHIPNALDVTKYEPNYNDSGYILFVGRLSREKGVLTLLRALKGLDVILRVAGDGPIRDQCLEFVEENRLKNVVFEGYKQCNELRELFRNAKFIVVPSEWFENAPMTCLEAFAYGKPVIGSDIGGIPELVIDGLTGLLFKPGDYQELREKIYYLLSNPTTIIQIGKNAREKIERQYNLELHYKKLIETYNKALL